VKSILKGILEFFVYGGRSLNSLSLSDWMQLIGTFLSSLIGGLIAFYIAKYQVNKQLEQNKSAKLDNRINSKFIFNIFFSDFTIVIEKVLDNFTELNTYGVEREISNDLQKVSSIPDKIKDLLIQDRHTLSSKEIEILDSIIYLMNFIVNSSYKYLRSDSTVRESLEELLFNSEEDLERFIKEFN
jgi:hypothetical protein